ncbi:MAG TPA: cytochrome C oxidase subunit IV family protein [bacterium]|nr:cytochrome C oxidase subunit IV family protein [bacterium]
MNPAPANHSMVFSLLVVLALIAVGISQIHLSPVMNNLLVFAIAFVMAGLVVSQYMGLKIEGPLVVWLFVIPIVLFAIMVVLMMPDIGHVKVDFLKAL